MNQLTIGLLVMALALGLSAWLSWRAGHEVRDALALGGAGGTLGLGAVAAQLL